MRTMNERTPAIKGSGRGIGLLKGFGFRIAPAGVRRSHRRFL
jgi:hypothetical protein